MRPLDETNPKPAEDASTWKIEDWRTQAQLAETPAWKRGIYRCIRPALSWHARRWLSEDARRRWAPEFVLYERGFPLEHRRAWATQDIDVAGATLLLQGVGTGWELLSWARLRPKRIFATDLFGFETWDAIARECRNRWHVPVEFREAPLEELVFLTSGSIDLCASDAVFEHCRDLDAVLVESHRVLRDRGQLYASFGPLWFAPGGDHFSPRAGLANVYAHVEMSGDRYNEFFRAHKYPVENFQSGGRYVELDLFSKLTPDEYLRKFRRAGFRIAALGVEICPRALAFERRYPARWQEIVRKMVGVATPDDLRAKGLFVRLTR